MLVLSVPPVPSPCMLSSHVLARFLPMTPPGHCCALSSLPSSSADLSWMEQNRSEVFLITHLLVEEPARGGGGAVANGAMAGNKVHPTFPATLGDLQTGLGGGRELMGARLASVLSLLCSVHCIGCRTRQQLRKSLRASKATSSPSLLILGVLRSFLGKRKGCMDGLQPTISWEISWRCVDRNAWFLISPFIPSPG